MNAEVAGKIRRYKHVFLDAEGTLYVPRHNRSRWEFWADPSPDAAVEFFELDKGVIEALERLRKQVDTLVVVSRNSDRILGALFEKFGIGHWFDKVMLNGNKGHQIRKYLHEHGLRKEDAIMIGDVPELDLFPVQKAGVDAILVDREYNQWASAERIRGVHELPEWLRIADLAEEPVPGRARNATLDDFVGASAPEARATKRLKAMAGA